MVDVTFDEIDGSQKEQVNVEIVGNEEAPHKAIKKLAIGEVKPKDDDNIVHVDLDPTTHHVSSNEHGEASATRNDQDGRSNETQGHSHEYGVNNEQAQPQLNMTLPLLPLFNVWSPSHGVVVVVLLALGAIAMDFVSLPLLPLFKVQPWCPEH